MNVVNGESPQMNAHTKELIERLRDWHDDWPAQEICKEAAAEIERLQDEIEYLHRAARGSDW